MWFTNGKLRICIDPQLLNAALKREHYQLPVLDDVLPKLKGAVSRQSSSFFIILPITRPQSLWNLKKAKKLHVNNKIRDPRKTNMSPEHYF